MSLLLIAANYLKTDLPAVDGDTDVTNEEQRYQNDNYNHKAQPGHQSIRTTF